MRHLLSGFLPLPFLSSLTALVPFPCFNKRNAGSFFPFLSPFSAYLPMFVSSWALSSNAAIRFFFSWSLYLSALLLGRSVSFLSLLTLFRSFIGLNCLLEASLLRLRQPSV